MFTSLVLSELYTATNADVPRLPWLLHEVPDQVLVRELWLGDVSPLLDFAAGPFGVTEEDGYFVLHGRDAKTNASAKLRILKDSSGRHVLQYCNGRYREWGESPFSNILLIPLSHRGHTMD